MPDTNIKPKLKPRGRPFVKGGANPGGKTRETRKAKASARQSSATLMASFTKAFLADFKRNGKGIIKQVREEKPVEYLKIATGLSQLEAKREDENQGQRPITIIINRLSDKPAPANVLVPTAKVIEHREEEDDTVH